MVGFRDRLRQLNSDLADKRITATEWADRFDSILLEGHAEAIRLGRARAGAEALDDDLLAEMARGAKDSQADHLNDFYDRVIDTDSRYFDDDGELREGLASWRSDLYVGRMRGTANDAFVDGSEDDEEFDWMLGAAEEHCEDCPEIAAGSPYNKETLYTTPGAGDTECIGNCTCLLVRSDGVQGFPRLHLDDEEED